MEIVPQRLLLPLVGVTIQADPTTGLIHEHIQYFRRKSRTTCRLSSCSTMKGSITWACRVVKTIHMWTGG